MDKVIAVLGLIVVFLGIVLGISALMAVPFWLIWNYVSTFLKIPHLTFFQAWGLSYLISMVLRAGRLTPVKIK